MNAMSTYRKMFLYYEFLLMNHCFRTSGKTLNGINISPFSIIGFQKVLISKSSCLAILNRSALSGNGDLKSLQSEKGEWPPMNNVGVH